MNAYTCRVTAESLATVIRETDLQIKEMRKLNMQRKRRLGRLIAELRASKGLSQATAGPILKAGGVMPCNIVGIENPSARRSYSVIMMMRAFRALDAYQP